MGMKKGCTIIFGTPSRLVRKAASVLKVGEWPPPAVLGLEITYELPLHFARLGNRHVKGLPAYKQVFRVGKLPYIPSSPVADRPALAVAIVHLVVDVGQQRGLDMYGSRLTLFKMRSISLIPSTCAAMSVVFILSVFVCKDIH